jgi:hypothetical protein
MKRPHKYGAEATVIGEERFSSKKEARRWQELLLLARAGEITDLERQYPIHLEGQNGPLRTPTGKVMKYVADFRYFDRRINAWVIEDSKGFVTKEFAIKKAVLEAMGIELRIT